MTMQMLTIFQIKLKIAQQKNNEENTFRWKVKTRNNTHTQRQKGKQQQKIRKEKEKLVVLCEIWSNKRSVYCKEKKMKNFVVKYTIFLSDKLKKTSATFMFSLLRAFFLCFVFMGETKAKNGIYFKTNDNNNNKSTHKK